MADNQDVQAHLIGLGRGTNGFFCPESRFHLMGGVKPQDLWPAAAPLTQAVKIGLRAGTLKDIHGTIPFEAFASKKQLAAFGKSASTEEEDFIMDDDDQTGDKTPAGDQTPAGDAPDGNAPTGDKTPDANADGSDDDKDGNAPDGDKLTEDQINELGRKDLLAFIKKHEIDMEVLDLNSRSNEAEIKDALKIHFGYKMV